MKDYPLIVFVALLLVQAVAEFTARLRMGTLGRKHRREWTYHAISVPYKLLLVAAILEYLSVATRPSLSMVLVGALLTAAGIVIRVVGHFQLAGAFTPYVETAEGQQLIQAGLYATVRHPMYLGTFLLFVGMPLMLASGWGGIVAAIGLLGILVRIRKEEAFLLQQLPGYREYVARTWRLLPHIY